MKTLKWILLLTLRIRWQEEINAQQVEHTNSKSGIYFDAIGYISFFPTNWTVLSYLNLEPTSTLWKTLRYIFKKLLLVANI